MNAPNDGQSPQCDRYPAHPAPPAPRRPTQEGGVSKRSVKMGRSTELAVADICQTLQLCRPPDALPLCSRRRRRLCELFSSFGDAWNKIPIVAA